MDSDPILKETLDHLRYHFHPEWRDRTPFDVFTRLLAKKIRAPKWKPSDHEPVKPSRVTSERQIRSTEQLAKLVHAETQDQPWNESGPIIIAVYRSKEWLLDGATRINKWMREGNDDDHTVHVHVIE